MSNSKFRSVMFALLFALGLSFVNLFANVGSVAAAPQKPPKPVATYESLQDEPVAGADTATATVQLHAVMMGSGDARLIMENVQGAGVLTGTLTTEGKPAFDFSVDLKNAPYPGVVVARAFAPKGQDVHWLVYYNGENILDQTSTPFKGVVHLWAELNPANPCEVNGFYQEDPGIDAQVDQQQPIHEWFSASEGSFGKFIVTTDGWHELKATAGRSKKLEADGTFGDKRGRLSFKWFANCGKTETPVVSCDNVDPRTAALKPGEQVEFTLTGTNAVSYKFEMGGKKVSETNKYVFTAKEVGTYNLSGFVTGKNGTFVSGDNCNAQIVVSEKTTNVVSCDNVDPRTAALKPGEQVEFTLTGTNASRYQFRAGDTVLSNTDKYIFKADTIGTFDFNGFVAGTDGEFVSGPACVARIVVTKNPPSGRDRMWPTNMPIMQCAELYQYNGEPVWVKSYRLIHINVENRDPSERWDVVSSSFSADGVNWTTTMTPTREIGIESRSIPMEQVVWVNFDVQQLNSLVPTFGATHLLRDSLPGVNPLDYEMVRRLGFHIPNPLDPTRILGPARKGTAADAEYEWAYKVNVARCATKTSTPPQSVPPVKVRACFRAPDGSLGRFEFEGEVPAGYTPLADEACEVRPPALPKTAGEIDEVEAEALIASANQDALWATLAIFVIFFGVLMVSRRRFAGAKAR